jgi:hypothetical protein
MTHLMIAKLAREHGVETFLAGDGGNELFGSNMRYVTVKSFRSISSVASVASQTVI